MYVMHTRLTNTYTDRFSVTSHLYEMTPAQFANAVARLGDKTDEWYTKTSAHHAHKHVLRGGLHSTALYVDEGRIRRAYAPEGD